MAAPKNNKYYLLREYDGRPKKFESPKQFLNECMDYFKWCDNNPWYRNEAIKSGNDAGRIIKIPTKRPYTLVGLCNYLGIVENTFKNYESDENYKDYFTVVTHVRNIINNDQLEGACVDAYNANIIARVLGLVEKTNNTNKNLNINSKELTKEEMKEFNDILENEY